MNYCPHGYIAMTCPTCGARGIHDGSLDGLDGSLQNGLNLADIINRAADRVANTTHNAPKYKVPVIEDGTP